MAKTRSKKQGGEPAAKKQKTAQSPKKESKSQVKEYGYVSKKQATSALTELSKYLDRQKETSEKSQLFDDDDEDDVNRNVYLEVQKKKYFSKKPGFKAKLISIPKPYINVTNDVKTCFFVRDSFIQTNEDLEKIEEANIPTLSKILTLKQLKTIYHPFEKRRELYREYDVFVTDDAILSSLPNVLGKTLYDNQKTKFPVQIRPYAADRPKELSIDKLKKLIEKVLASAPYLPPMGTTAVFKLGALNKHFTQEDLLDNLHAILKEFEQDDLVTVGIRTERSPVLPLFYTDKIYNDDDVLESAPEEAETEVSEDAYATALFELADEETVNSALKDNRMGKLARSKA